MRRSRINKKYFVPALIGTSVISSCVWAQNAPAVPQAKLEEVIVSAQRRQEKLEDVPLSVTAVSAEALERSGVSSIEDIGRLSAGVQVNRAGSFTQPSVRGITTLTLGFGFENNVAVYVDGLYQADMVSINTDLANISSVQILKGPQGTLYGRNATGGAIVIETLDPGKEATGKMQASYGDNNDQRLQAYLAAPLTDDIGFSIAGYSRNDDGYIRDVGTLSATSADNYDAAKIEDKTIRAKLKWTPTDNLAITLGQNYTDHLDARGVAYRYSEHTAAPPLQKNEVALNLVPDTRVIVHETTGKVLWDTGVGTLTSATGYTEKKGNSIFDFDGQKQAVTSPTASLSISKQLDMYTFQQSLDFYSNAIERFDINVGATYFRDRLHNDNANAYSNALVLLRSQFIDLETDAMAAYADVTWQATDRLFLTAGYRYSAEDKSVAYHETPGLPVPAVLPAQNDDTFESGTPRFVVRYELDPDTNVYASYTAGFRSGAFNPSPLPRPDLVVPVKEEKINAYEIGFKTVTDTMRFSTAAFYYDYTDLQVGLTVPDRGGSPIQQIFNAPEAESYGGEVQVDYLVTTNFNVTANLAYTHARYTDFDIATGTGLNGATQFNISNQPQDWTDQEMARAPEWTANLGADYTFNNVVGGDLVLALNVAYTDSFVPANLSLYGPGGAAAPGGSFVANPSPNKQRYRIDSYTTVNGQANWTDATGHYTMGVFCNNLTDEEYPMVYTGSGTGDFTQLAEERNYGVKVGYNF